MAESNLSESKGLLELNDDCLTHIFSYLSLKDQIALVTSHERFTVLFELSNINAISTDQLKGLSLCQVRLCLKFAGEKLKKFIIKGNHKYKKNNSFYEYVKTYCTNLKKIGLVCLSKSSLNDTQLNILLSSKSHLTTLYLVRLCISDVCFDVISKLPHLEQLYIQHCYEITGAELKHVRNLKKLSLIQNLITEPKYLEVALSQMPKLQALCLVHTNKEYPGLIEKLPNICKNLEGLYISCKNANYGHVANLEKLKSIFFRDISDISAADLAKLVAKRSNQIETLSANFLRSGINENKVLLIAQLKNLKVLHCSNIDDECLKAFTSLKKLVELKICWSLRITNTALLELVYSCRQLKWLTIKNTSIDNNFAISLLPLVNDQRPLTILAHERDMIKFEDDFPQELKDSNSSIRFIFEDVDWLESYHNLSHNYLYNDLLMYNPFFLTNTSNV